MASHLGWKLPKRSRSKVTAHLPDFSHAGHASLGLLGPSCTPQIIPINRSDSVSVAGTLACEHAVGRRSPHPCQLAPQSGGFLIEGLQGHPTLAALLLPLRLSHLAEDRCTKVGLILSILANHNCDVFFSPSSPGPGGPLIANSKLRQATAPR